VTSETKNSNGDSVLSHDPQVFETLAVELGIPLREILVQMEAIADRRLDATSREQLSAGRTSIGAMISLLDTFGHLPAIDEGRLNLDISVFELESVVASVIRRVEPAAALRKNQLSQQIDSAAARRLAGDPGRLAELLFYLMHTAIRIAPGVPLNLHVMPDVADRTNMLIRFQVVGDAALLDAHQVDQMIVLDKAPPLAWRLQNRMAQVLGGRIGVECVSGDRFLLWLTARLYRPGTICESRRTNRQLQEMLLCNHGPVIDLSACGMRMLSKRPKRGLIGVRMLETDPKIKLRGRVVWNRKVSRHQHETGVRFVGLRAEQLAQLNQLASYHGMRG
jgi:hypothetical protein